jgi:hypothetical protein
MALLYAVIGAVIGVILTALFLDPIQAVFVRLLGGLSPASGRRRSVQGTWFAYYEIWTAKSGPVAPNTALDESRIERISLKQIGSTVIGKNVKESRDYFLRLKARDETILTGVWTDNSDGRYHYGACQLCYEYGGHHLIGVFVGRDRNNDVNFGPWIFARERDELAPAVNAWRELYYRAQAD